MTTETFQLADRLQQALATVTVTSVNGFHAFRVGDVEFQSPSLSEFRGKLSGALYDTFHAGRDSQQQRPRWLRDPAFEDVLAAAMPYQHTTGTGRYAGRLDSGEILAELGSLRVKFTPDDVEGMAQCQIGDLLRLRLPASRPALSPGFYLADSPDGPPPAGPLLRLYVHLADPHQAAAAWRACMLALKAQGVRYRAKISSAPWLYPRMDALVVYLGHDAWPAVGDVVDVLASLPGKGTDTSVFASRLAPGISYAWEPADARVGKSNMSFGQHRSAALTDGLLAAATAADTRKAAVLQALCDANIDPGAPERNLDSPPLQW
ncbi:T3SS effector HopA1 family protein [Streptomyces sp. NPDC048191]|uniref:T3SS effector HopA1 family protein n=1 Tax=Streptomyces sp. NPDC048191 TaxID=3155484 RepID=UPI0033DEC47A